VVTHNNQNYLDKVHLPKFKIRTSNDHIICALVQTQNGHPRTV